MVQKLEAVNAFSSPDIVVPEAAPLRHAIVRTIDDVRGQVKIKYT
jgi:hypothetical protein